MAEMLVNAPESGKVVYDYDFIFSSGLVIPITIDPEAGDSIEFNEDTVVVNTAARPSIGNPKESVPAEKAVINKRHLLVYQCRERVVRELTPEEQFQLQESMHRLTGSVQ